MNWRRGLFRLWIVLSASWVGFLYLFVDPGHDIYKDAIVSSMSVGPGLVVPLDISAEGVHAALVGYYHEVTPGNQINDTQLASDTKLVWAEIQNTIARNQNEHRTQWRDFVAFGVVAPAAALALGVVAGWVVSGFRTRASRQ